MFFSIKIPNGMNETLARFRILSKAKTKILRYPLGATELELDQFLKTNLKLSLKQTCLFLLTQVSIMSINNSELRLIFKNPKFDYIARLITYGNGKLKGSKILKTAFTFKD